MPAEPERWTDIIWREGAGPSWATRSPPTTSHRAGAIKTDSPAGKYSPSTASERKDFNSYGCAARNHEVMIRGTFANIRLRNQLAPGTRRCHHQGRASRWHLDRVPQYIENGTPLIVLGGKEYGSARPGLGRQGHAACSACARATESFERIHRPTSSAWACCGCSTKPGVGARSA